MRAGLFFVSVWDYAAARRRRSNLVIAAFLLSLVLLLGGCSDSPAAQEAPEATPDAVAAPAAPASPDDPVPNGARQVPPFDPASFTLEVEPVVSGLRAPLFVTHAGDGSGRMFIVEQGGTIRIAVNGQVQREPFLDVTSLVVSGGERGLLGLAFHPRYRENGRFFIYYTARGTGENTVAAYRVSADPDHAEPRSTAILFAIPDRFPNHNGGMIAFGPDSYLYIGTGDGGSGGDPDRNGQNRQALLGKILRVDVDGGDPYAIPPDNPFVGQDDALPEVWAYGLRNPWRFSFDRATNDLWIGDVGQNAYEEIDLQPAGSRGGENYGWNRMEASQCFPIGSRCSTDGLVMPVAEYPTRRPECAVTSGYVYRGSAYPALAGGYFYADYCSGRIWSLHPGADGTWVPTELLDTDLSISSFGEDEAGEVYLTDLAGGRVYRLTAVAR